MIYKFLRRITMSILAFAVSLCFLNVAVLAVEEPQLSAQTAVLLCANNGEILFGKDENQQMKPASTTKIMTALLALEKYRAYPNDIEITTDMYAEGSSMYLQAGDKLSLYSLAEGMMMVSGNDAANAIAIALSGDIQGFADLMNKKAQQIGMKNTHFLNPNGLDEAEHYSSAYDLALLMSYAMENDDFAKITSEQSAQINFTEPAEKTVTYSNHNKLLWMYDYCVGGKTGYTIASGRTLVSVAEKDGLRLVAVTMNDRNDWDDHIALFEYGFSQRKLLTFDDTKINIEIPVELSDDETAVLNARLKAEAVVPIDAENSVQRKLNLPQTLEAPVDTVTPLGEVQYYLDGKIIASTPIYSKTVVEKKLGFFEGIFNIIEKIIKQIFNK